MTFLLRGKRIALSSLNLTQIEYSYRNVFSEASYSVEDRTLTEMAVMTKGYSYAFQLLGYLAWKKAKHTKIIDANLLEQIKPEYLLELDQNACTKIFDGLSNQDRKFLYAMAKSDKNRVLIKDIRQRLNRPSNFVANYRRRLLDNQVIKVTNYGEVAFTLPFFREYVLKRQVFEELE